MPNDKSLGCATQAPLRFVISGQEDSWSPLLCGSAPEAEPELAGECHGEPFASLPVPPTSPQAKTSMSTAVNPALDGRRGCAPDSQDVEEAVEWEAAQDKEAEPQLQGVASEGEKAKVTLQASEHASEGKCQLREPVLGDCIENREQTNDLASGADEQAKDSHKESAASKAAKALGACMESWIDEVIDEGKRVGPV